MSNKVFTTKSPLGYNVVCLSDDWEHIVTSHPDMKGKESIIKNTVEDPLIIYPSDEYDNRDVYFSKNFAYKTDIVLYTKVVVQHSPDDPHVVTAFKQKKIFGNIKEEIKYVKPKL